MVIYCTQENNESAGALCTLEEKSHAYPIAIGSPPEAWAEGRVFVCPRCEQKAFILTKEIAEPAPPDTLFGGGSNRDDHGEPEDETG